MSKKSKIYILIAVIIVTFAILSSIALFLYINSKNEQDIKQNDNYSSLLEDGSKINISKKLNENKKFDGLDITDIKLTEKGQLTKLTATLTNNTEEKKGDYTVNIIFVDSNGNELSKMGTYIKLLMPGESTLLNSSVTFDYSNAYDIIIERP